jgi:hypothetical protein
MDTINIFTFFSTVLYFYLFKLVGPRFNPQYCEEKEGERGEEIVYYLSVILALVFCLKDTIMSFIDISEII